MAHVILRRLQALPRASAALQQAASSPSQLVQLAAFASSSAAASGRLVGACVLERLPVVFPYPPQWEMEHMAWQQQLAAKRRKPVPREFTDPKQSEEMAAAEGAAGRWKPADRETEADRSGDKRVLRRRLDQFLFLLVRPRGAGADAPWTFLSAQNGEGESMRATAERALAEGLQLDGVQTFFVGNAPSGHQAAGSSSSSAAAAGAGDSTLFFHRCQLIQGVPSLKAGGPWGDHAWVAKDELGDYIKDEALLELLKKML